MSREQYMARRLREKDEEIAELRNTLEFLREQGDHHIDIGETVVVRGRRFICVEMTEEMGAPARVTFKQPVELIEQGGET